MPVQVPGGCIVQPGLKHPQHTRLFRQRHPVVARHVAGVAGLALPAVEPMILASAIILGALVALALRPGMAALLPVMALFGAAHGWAHGAEGPSLGMGAYLAGAAVMTLALHMAGVGLGRALTGLALRGLGGVTLAAGLGLAVVG